MTALEHINDFREKIERIENQLRGKAEIDRRMIVPMCIDRVGDDAKLVDELIVAYVRLKATVQTRLAEINTEITMKSRPGALNQNELGKLVRKRDEERRYYYVVLESLPTL
ncbi:MAG: hypothetical protein WC813_01840 [Patescibacteria group bacterium]|jgi:hypothetical protein